MKVPPLDVARAYGRDADSWPMPDTPPNLVPITLVPVEVFGGDCDCHERAGHNFVPEPDIAAVVPDNATVQQTPQGVLTVVPKCHGWGYGLMDAVPGWSDCNRASGRIYRVEDGPFGGITNQPPDVGRRPGTTMTVYVRQQDLPWFEHRWGEDRDDGDTDG